MTPLGNGLGTAQINVHRIAVILCRQRRLEDLFGIVATELNDQRPVGGACLQRILPVLGIRGEQVGMEHGRVAELGSVTAAQHPPGQLTLVHHGSHHIAWRSQSGAIEVVALQLARCPTALIGFVYHFNELSTWKKKRDEG